MACFAHLPPEVIHYLAETIQNTVYDFGGQSRLEVHNWPHRPALAGVRNLAKVNKCCYETLLPLLFRSVMLSTLATPPFLHALRESPRDPGRYVKNIMFFEWTSSNKSRTEMYKQYVESLTLDASDALLEAANQTTQPLHNMARFRVLEKTPALERLLLHRTGMLPLFKSYSNELPFLWRNLEHLSIFDNEMQANVDGVDVAQYLPIFVRSNMRVRGLSIGITCKTPPADMQGPPSTSASDIQNISQHLRYVHMPLFTDTEVDVLSPFLVSPNLAYVHLLITGRRPDSLQLLDFFKHHEGLPRTLQGLRIEAASIYEELNSLCGLIGVFERYDFLAELRLPAQCLDGAADGTSIRLAVSRIPRTLRSLQIDFKWGCHLIDEEKDVMVRRLFFAFAVRRLRALRMFVQSLVEWRQERALAPRLRIIQVDELLEISVLNALKQATEPEDIAVRDQLSDELRQLQEHLAVGGLKIFETSSKQIIAVPKLREAMGHHFFA